MLENIPNNLIFDRNLLLKRKLKTLSSLAKADFLIKRSFEDINEKLEEMNREFPSILNFGSRSADLSEALLNRKGTKNLIESQAFFQHNPKAIQIIADEEHPPFAANQFDLIVSILNLHSINDLPGCLSRLRKSLKPNGVIIASLFGENNLPELRETLITTEMELFKGISPRMMPCIEMKQLGSLLQRASFASPIIDKDTATVYYQNPMSLLQDIQNMSENNIMLNRSKNYVGKAFWDRFSENYIQNFSVNEHEVIASFEILTLTAINN
jgi:NADH dehydrogenase [ubiquinone] 1 alpha subcomplex assembly factor 5